MLGVGVWLIGCDLFVVGGVWCIVFDDLVFGGFVLEIDVWFVVY